MVLFFLFRFPVGSFAIQSIIKSVTNQFSTQSHLNQVGVLFFFKHGHLLSWHFFTVSTFSEDG